MAHAQLQQDARCRGGVSEDRYLVVLWAPRGIWWGHCEIQEARLDGPLAWSRRALLTVCPYVWLIGGKHVCHMNLGQKPHYTRPGSGQFPRFSILWKPCACHHCPRGVPTPWIRRTLSFSNTTVGLQKSTDGSLSISFATCLPPLGDFVPHESPCKQGMRGAVSYTHLTLPTKA